MKREIIGGEKELKNIRKNRLPLPASFTFFSPPLNIALPSQHHYSPPTSTFFFCTLLPWQQKRGQQGCEVADLPFCVTVKAGDVSFGMVPHHGWCSQQCQHTISAIIPHCFLFFSLPYCCYCSQSLTLHYLTHLSLALHIAADCQLEKQKQTGDGGEKVAGGQLLCLHSPSFSP